MSHANGRFIAMLALLGGTLSASISSAVAHDPFWPIGYTPAPVAVAIEEEPVAKEATASTVTQPLFVRRGTGVSAASLKEWIAARKTLRIAGTTSVQRADGRHQIIYINGKGYTSGDVVTVTARGVRFSWRVREDSEDQELRLKPLKAERLNSTNSK
ncbi:MAG: hypothetical protein RR268_06305 [Kiritimatiellia bacterium]